MKKPWKVIKSKYNSGEIKVFGNNHFIEIEYKIPEWNKSEPDADLEPCFEYKGGTYFLSEFMRIDINSPFYIKQADGLTTVFDGYMPDSFFSGILVKYSDCGDGIKAFTYIS